MSKVDEAFQNVSRQFFVPAELGEQWRRDVALPIGYGQTISQPYTVHAMLEWLNASPGNKVLDVGSGSGWTTALLSHIVGNEGKVYAVERIPELVDFGRENCQNSGVSNVEFHQAGKRLGLKEFAPYDCILVSAAANTVPLELMEQLKAGGKMVIPVGNDIFEIEKNKDSDVQTVIHNGFIFVPLIREKKHVKSGE